MGLRLFVRHYRQVVSCPLTCDPTDDRACVVFLKMNGVVRDERRIRDYFERRGK